jgi:uncharacterized membrane protein YGL010W
MQTLAELLSSYQSYHTKFATRVTHYIGIPLVVFSLLIFFGWIHIKVPNVFDLPLSWLITIAVLIYYAFLDITFAGTLAIVFLILNLIASYFSLPAPTWLGVKVFFITFIVGWAFQFVGHLLEGNKPAFLTNAIQLLVAPLFLTAEAFFALGYKQDLQIKVMNEEKQSD